MTNFAAYLNAGPLNIIRRIPGDNRETVLQGVEVTKVGSGWAVIEDRDRKGVRGTSTIDTTCVLRVEVAP